MEFHKPKPFHNWREFFKEYAIIVIGVLTALAAEQAVEAWHWRSQVREAREVIASEMAYNLEGAIWRMRTIDCVERRLDSLAKILDEAARTGNLPPVGYIAQSPRHMWRSGAWDSVVASQTATHFPREQLADLGALYKVVQRIEDYSMPDAMVWGDLYAMVGPGRRLDPTSEAGLRSAISRARNTVRTIANLSTFLVAQAGPLDMPFTKSELDKLAMARKASLSQPPQGIDISSSATSPTLICLPVGAVPPNYGEAPVKNSADFVSNAAKFLPDFGEDRR
jgi:hypothetical protein